MSIRKTKEILSWDECIQDRSKDGYLSQKSSVEIPQNLNSLIVDYDLVTAVLYHLLREDQ